MRAILLIARSRLRHNLTATLLLVLVAGIGGGAVMGAVAGIRRADRAWADFQAAHPEGDAVAAVLTPDLEFPAITDTDFTHEAQTIRSFPGVTAAVRITAMLATGRRLGSDDEPSAFVALVHLDPPVVALSGDPIVVAGRAADSGRADEAVIDEDQAAQYDLALGDRVEVRPFLPDQFDDIERSTRIEAHGAASTVRIVGVIRDPSDVLGPRSDVHATYTSDPYVELTPAWWAAHGPAVATYGTGIGVDLDAGPSGRERFRQQMQEEYGDRGLVAPGLEFGFGIQPEVRQAVGGRIGAEGRALAVFAAVAALAALALASQALVRQLRAEDAARSTLVALGLSRRALVGVALVRTLAVAIGAALVAAAVSVGASTRLPIGAGSRVVRDPGLDVDPMVLAVGSVVVVLTVVAIAVLGSVGTGRTAARASRRRSFADRAAALGAPASAVVGLRMAFDRSAAGRAGRSAIGAAALAVAVAVAAAGLVGSYRGLADEPDRLGQVWDLSLGNFVSEDAVREAVEELSATDGVDVVGGEVVTNVEVEGRPATAVGYTAEVGQLEPRVYEGRAPTQAGEVLLGEQIARELHRGVGDEVQLAFPFESTVPPGFRVVGIGAAGSAVDDTAPGRSVLLTPDVITEDIDTPVPQVLLLRFSPGVDRSKLVRLLEARFPDTVVPAPILPRRVQTVGSLTGLPVLLAVVVGVLAAGVVLNALVGSVRRRRGQLAVLKALGCDRRQVGAVVAWQATGWSLAALAVGVPLGLLLGSVGWRAVERDLGLHSPTVVPVLVLVAVGVAVPVLVNLAALLPARAVARIPAAEALRSE